jgi:hypothetical protein
MDALRGSKGGKGKDHMEQDYKSYLNLKKKKW